MKINIKYNLMIATALLCCISAFAQQLPQFTQYMFNTVSINPAYAGSRETLNITALHRSQWVGIEGAPVTQTASIHSPLRNERIGLGLSFINDHLGFENFSYVYGDFSYTIKTGKKTELAFGLKGGFTFFNLDQKLLDDSSIANDPFFNEFSNRIAPNFGVGFYWHTNKWYIGLSAPRILNTDLNNTRNNIQANFVSLERINYFLTAGYVFDLNDAIKFKPSVLARATNGAPASFDFTTNFLFNEKFWLGAAYRINEQTEAIGALVDFQISNQLRIGYAYEYPLSDLRAYTGGTHEVLLIFEVFKSKRIKSPRYF
ncbi:type IX secretion system membrane protein PorP/SprF [Flavivirga spongiicola]|uniref:Type IX secretion system membrane protein PorP/SprF n=1 Tax=Flavivirga spongiicola TaxID=421621 RepID=A0ABU7XYI0_9FLAO|nr:type IX secretion system membrane protein PorP/SprF [Flavivirga sp. MEBiC05379]MDO5980834.1 type IX secretion system membrane protein PorP/SprF [Flavivirga sp. MEBiC05379]